MDFTRSVVAMADDMQELQAALGYRFADPVLLLRAFTHASAAEQPEDSYERLEFLGDAVVGLTAAEHLFRTFPSWSEGQMTQTKSALVSRRTLARAGRALRLESYLHVDEGLRRQRRYTTSMISGTYEAVVGAIFVDGGLPAASDFVLRTLRPELERVLASRHAVDCKSALQKRSQADGQGIPNYTITRSEGPDHKRRFHAVVRVGGRVCGAGWGLTKREAEQGAACAALAQRYGEGAADGSDGDLP